MESNRSEIVTSVSQFECGTDDNKRKRLSGDDKLRQNRERNRVHARKTRERKKHQTQALQRRISDLQDESSRLRQLVDERYTASALLGLNQTCDTVSGGMVMIQSSASLCATSQQTLAEYKFFGCEPEQSGENRGNGKRFRRRGKYTPQERERIRRERNRMHAKKTRDKKKLFLEASEQIILELEAQTQSLRNYLLSVKILSSQEVDAANDRDLRARKELLTLKQASQTDDDRDHDDDDACRARPQHKARTNEDSAMDEDEYFDEDEEDRDHYGDGDDEQENDGSISGSDDNEKGSSWSGSSHSSSASSNVCSTSGRSSSSNDGSTTEDGGSSCAITSVNSNVGSNTGSGSDEKASNSKGDRSRSSATESSGSGSGGDSPSPNDEQGYCRGSSPISEEYDGVCLGTGTIRTVSGGDKDELSSRGIPSYPVRQPVMAGTFEDKVVTSLRLSSVVVAGVGDRVIGGEHYQSHNKSVSQSR